MKFQINLIGNFITNVWDFVLFLGIPLHVDRMDSASPIGHKQTVVIQQKQGRWIGKSWAPKSKESMPKHSMCRSQNYRR